MKRIYAQESVLLSWEKRAPSCLQGSNDFASSWYKKHKGEGGVKLRVFSQGSRRDFCLRNSILIKVETGGHPRTKYVTSLLFSGEVIAGLQSKWVQQKRGACPACPSKEQQQHGGACIWKRILQSLESGPDGDELWRNSDNNKRIKKFAASLLLLPYHISQKCAMWRRRAAEQT